MGVDIRAQALSLLLGCALGAGLGLLYDLLRPIRRRGGDTLWDLLFCLTAAAAAFLFAMRAENGVLGTGELLFSLLGLLLYFRLLSPGCFSFFASCLEKFRVLWINTQISAKKVGRNCKKTLFKF